MLAIKTKEARIIPCEQQQKQCSTSNSRRSISIWMQKHEFLGIPPFGYVYSEDHTQYLIDPDAAQIVRYAFDLALTGKSRTEIANALNANGYPTIAEYNHLQSKARKNHTPIPELPRWDSTKVGNLLRNPVYKGTLVCRKTTILIPSSNKKRKTDPSEQYIFDHSHEAIVTAEEFDRVQLLFPRQDRKPGRKVYDYPLRSVVFCGVCKRTMHRYRIAKGEDGARYYCRSAQLTNTTCTNKKYPEKELEQIVLQSLLPMLQGIQTSIGHRRSGQEQVQTMLGQCQHELREVHAMEKKLRLEKLEIYEAYISGKLSVQAYRRKKNEFKSAAKYSTRRSSVTLLPIPPWIPQNHTGPRCCPVQPPAFSASCIRCPAASKPSGEGDQPPHRQ